MKTRYSVQDGILQDNAQTALHIIMTLMALIALHTIMTTSCIDFYIH